jgi:hypothetical protein
MHRAMILRLHLRVAAVPLGAALLSAALLAACAQATSFPSSETPMLSQATSIAAGELAAPASVRVDGALATELETEFDYAPNSRIIEVRYTLHNRGDAPLAVFDRGDQHAIGSGRQAFGAVGIPRMDIDNEDISLVHAAVPLPDPAPTSPPTPVAIEVAPGASLEGEFKFALKGLVMPKRLRWCVGVMRVGDAYMDSPQNTEAGRLWRASFGVVEKQAMLCTPWYDVASAAFQAK